MSNSDAFRKMAERIDLNAEADFCGAFVIVPPSDAGTDTAEILLLNNRKDLAMFWGIVKGRAEVAIAELQMAERGGQQFGRR